MIAYVIIAIVLLLLFCFIRRDKTTRPADTVVGTPRSVNYHFTRRCNYQCKFCFHTAKTSHMMDMKLALQGITMLHEAGTKKLNFAGGEPFLYPKQLAEMVKHARQLGMTTSIVSNASRIKESWLRENGKHLDILAVSCDSAKEAVNVDTGRTDGKWNHIQYVRNVRDWCEKYNVKFKLNTVVTTANVEEDMSDFVRELRPFRWKVFQCLLLTGENVGDDALRNAESLVVTTQQFQQFLKRHKSVASLVPENNSDMKDSYIILDEYMRFLDCTKGGKDPSPSILEVGVMKAFDRSGFDERTFLKRGGRFKFRRGTQLLDW